MYVVVWEPRRGAGGGHQLVMDQRRAEQISRVMAARCRMPRSGCCRPPIRCGCCGGARGDHGKVWEVGGGLGRLGG